MSIQTARKIMAPDNLTKPQTVLDVSVVVNEPQWLIDDPAIEEICIATAQRAFEAAQKAFEQARRPNMSGSVCEACIVLADDDFVADLNNRYRDQQGPTNVLSFAALDELDEVDGAGLPDLPDGMPLVLGDVIIARGVLHCEAKDQGISTINHTRHLVVHGILHLLGYDHIEDSDATRMESLETDILATMGVDNPHYNGLDKE